MRKYCDMGIIVPQYWAQSYSTADVLVLLLRYASLTDVYLFQLLFANAESMEG